MGGFFIRKAQLIQITSLGYCFYCGSSENLSIDHIHPKSKGGEHKLYNLTRACKSCNSYKKDKSIEEFKERIERHRIEAFSFFVKYAIRYRKIRDRDEPQSKQWFLAKLTIMRRKHSYFSSIIGSIISKSYIAFPNG